MRWAMPSLERCICQGVIAKKGAMMGMCPLTEEDYGYDGEFWYTDEPTPLTVRSNWYPVKLNKLLEREAICSKLISKMKKKKSDYTPILSILSRLDRNSKLSVKNRWLSIWDTLISWYEVCRWERVE